MPEYKEHFRLESTTLLTLLKAFRSATEFLRFENGEEMDGTPVAVISVFE